MLMLTTINKLLPNLKRQCPKSLGHISVFCGMLTHLGNESKFLNEIQLERYVYKFYSVVSQLSTQRLKARPPATALEIHVAFWQANCVTQALLQATLHEAGNKLALENEEKHQQRPHNQQCTRHDQAPFGPAFAHLGK